MQCPACKRLMTPLFISYACDWCDGLVQVDWQSGFVVFRGEDDFDRPVYVFPSRTEAALYRQLQGWQHHQIREIHFQHPVQWKSAGGKLQGVTIAARPFELHRDHKFESLPYTGWLVPLHRADVAA
jgi:hypothetical protein